MNNLFKKFENYYYHNKWLRIFYPIFLFILILLIIMIPVVSANEITESYYYGYDLEITNDSYYMSVSTHIDYNYIFDNDFETISFSVDILHNNINYNLCYIIISNISGIVIRLVDGINDISLDIYSWYVGQTHNYYNFNRFNLFNNSVYTIVLNPTINYFFNFENYINKGYYTFNQSISGLDFNYYNFHGVITNYNLNGSLVYLNEDGYYLFNYINLNPTQNYFTLKMFRVGYENTSYGINGNFTNETDFLRYWYLDNQYIDTFVYKYLINNGYFGFSYTGLDTNASFWDVINAYVNIPNTVISGMLDFSIFNGSTLLLIFATISIIVLAVKIIKLVNWS